MLKVWLCRLHELRHILFPKRIGLKAMIGKITFELLDRVRILKTCDGAEPVGEALPGNGIKLYCMIDELLVDQDTVIIDLLAADIFFPD